MTTWDCLVKRTFDITLAAIGLLLSIWLIGIAIVIAAIDTRSSGMFRQQRIGKDGRVFSILKIRTMRTAPDATTVTTVNDTRITRIGGLLRRFKIDELPQLVNVLAGQMSFVGPRPDVPGFADELEGAQRIILSVRPGITGPATLYFRDEEVLLSKQADPERYNREVVFPIKVKLNMRYVKNYRFSEDLRIVWATIAGLSYDELYGSTKMEA